MRLITVLFAALFLTACAADPLATPFEPAEKIDGPNDGPSASEGSDGRGEGSGGGAARLLDAGEEEE